MSRLIEYTQGHMGMARTLLSSQSTQPDAKMSLHPNMQGEHLAGPDSPPQRITRIKPQDQSFLSRVIEKVKSAELLRPRKVSYPWTGETHFRVDARRMWQQCVLHIS